MLTGLATALQSALSPLYGPALLIAPGGAPTSDGQGGWMPAAPDEHPCRALVTDYTDKMRAAGIPLNHRMALVLQNSLPVAPRAGQTLDVDGAVWQIVSVKQDPAQAAWMCEVYQTTEGGDEQS